MAPTATELEIGPKGRRAGWRRAGNALRLALVAYLVVVLLLSWLQAYLIFPGRLARGRPELRHEARAGEELVPLTTARGERIVALFGPALDPHGGPRSDAASRPTVLFFYGNGSSVSGSLGIYDRLRRIGVNVLIPEYVGYGMSEGVPSEAGCYATADAAYDYLLGRADVDRSKIVAAGWSLGGAVAIDLAARREVAGLMVFNTFTTMMDMASVHYPWLPARWLLRHRFESVDKIGAVEVPALIVHGDEDRLIPPVMSDRLADAAGGMVTRLDVPGAGHNDVFDVGGRALLDAFARFLGRLGSP